MADTVFEMTGLNEIAVNLDSMNKESMKAAKNAFEYVCRLIANEARNDPGGFTDRTGNLRNSIGVVPEPSDISLIESSEKRINTKQEITIGEKDGGFIGTIFAGMEYAVYVEFTPGHYVISGAFNKYRERWLGILVDKMGDALGWG